MADSSQASNMGKRNMSAPAITSDSMASSSDANNSYLQELLRRMPAQYALATSYSDREQHARLLNELQATQKSQQQLAVCISWQPVQTGGATVWLVFADRRGSLGLITSLLSELGVNIGKASVFSSTDGIAADAFTVDRCAPFCLTGRRE